MNFNDLQLSQLRRDYKAGELDEKSILCNPTEQFSLWFEQALHSQLLEPAAMSIATVSENGQPSLRTVLLKGFDERGFVFYTNYESRKGCELHTNPNAALLFYWDILERQVRIEGRVEKIAEQLSDAYFDTRPQESRISAYISPQSQIIESRKSLENKFVAFEQQCAANANLLQRPPYWGGYCLVPHYFEFWQGRIGRLHDRIAYFLSSNNDRHNCQWQIERLAP